jgi:RimJ/RimL family protein N-acetyltransferase
VSTNYRLKNGAFLTVADAEPEDAAEILAFVNAVGQETPFLTFGDEGIGMSVAEETEYLRACQRSAGASLMLKGMVSGEIVSTLSLSRVARVRVRHAGEFGLSVRRSHWGLGIARLMMEEMVRRARELGLRKINLRVREDNERAKTLYERFGFVGEGFRSRAYFVDEKFYGEHLMGLELD